MRRITKAALVAAVCSVAVTVAAQAADGDHKVLLCHATDSATNPYELISVDVHGAEGHLKAGHGDSTHTDFLLPDGWIDCTDDGEF
jgi:opacity protein-like surface antigen